MPLTPDQLRILRALETRKGSDSVLEFIARCNVAYTEGQGTLRPYHLKPLIDLFLEAELKGKVRATCSVPPQMGKTTTILHGSTRYLQRNPKRHVAFVGYSHGFVMEKARDARRIADACGLRLSLDTVCDWRTPEGGSMTFTSKGGKLLGLKKDLIVIDDPHSGMAEAMSPVETAKDLEWLVGNVLSRLSDPWGSVIVNGARWAHSDLIGQLLENDPKTWRNVNIRAILDEGTENERSLWPEVRSLEWLKEQRRQFNSQNRLIWPANYEGTPVVEGGQMFGEAHFYGKFDWGGNYRISVGVDVATSPGRGDHSSIFVMAATGVGADQKFYVLDYWTGQVAFGELAKQIAEKQERWGCEAAVETNGVGAGIPDMIRMIDPKLKIHGHHSDKSKAWRAAPLATAWNQGRVMLPRITEIDTDALVRRIRSFTGEAGGPGLDDVDAMALTFKAVNRLVEAAPVGGKVYQIRGMN